MKSIPLKGTKHAKNHTLEVRAYILLYIGSAPPPRGNIQCVTNAIETLYVKDSVLTCERRLYLNTLLVLQHSQASTHTAVRTQLLNCIMIIPR